MAASFGLLFAGLSALDAFMGGSPYAPAGVAIGLVASGLALSLAANQVLEKDPPERDQE